MRRLTVVAVFALMMLAAPSAWASEAPSSRE